MTPEEQERIIAEAVRREVAKAPPLPADAVDLLRRLGFPGGEQTRSANDR